MPAVGDLCKRCKKQKTTILSRKDTFCDPCFVRFIRGKQRKQMQSEKFKVKFKKTDNGTRILMDMRNNHESYAMFDIVFSMLVEQLTQGPKAVRGFDLVVCVIKDSQDQVNIEGIKEMYGESELERLGIQFLVIDPEAYIKMHHYEHLRLDLKKFETIKFSDSSSGFSYENVIAQVSDKSTREDIVEILHEDMLVQASVDNKCTMIAKPFSMTKLAVDILSDTIRGRGSEIPRFSRNEYVGSFEMIYPLRDILSSEIKIYSSIQNLNSLSLELTKTQNISNISTKNKTVKDMVLEYFQTLEVEYPEVVSTVVKIGGKLTNPEPLGQNKKCEICKVTIFHHPKTWLEQITVPGFVGPRNEEEEANFRRYLDSITEENVEEDKNVGFDEKVNLCYGCMVTLGVSEVKDFQWPQRPTKEEVLAEYIISDGED